MNGINDLKWFEETTLYNFGGREIYSYYDIFNKKRFGFKIYNGLILTESSAGFNLYRDAQNALEKTVRLLKGGK